MSDIERTDSTNSYKDKEANNSANDDQSVDVRPFQPDANRHSSDSSSSGDENLRDLENGAIALDESDDQKMMRVETHSQLSREISRKLTGAEHLTIDSSEPCPKMGGGRDYPPMLPDASD
ncbi:hypothetical protein CANINC_001248, partial [Pichia inconspicua]